MVFPFSYIIILTKENSSYDCNKFHLVGYTILIWFSKTSLPILRYDTGQKKTAYVITEHCYMPGATDYACVSGCVKMRVILK